jgi:hypothetical protein
VNDFIPGTESFENTNYVNGMQKSTFDSFARPGKLH